MNPMIIDEMTVRPAVSAEALHKYLFSNRMRGKSVRQLDTDWPQAPVLRQLLVEYASIGIVDGKTPVVFTAISAGVNVYDRLLANKPDWVRLYSVMDVTINTLARQIAGIEVTSRTGKMWTPQGGSTLQHWINREGSGTVEVRQAKPEMVKSTRETIIRQINQELPPAVAAKLNE